MYCNISQYAYGTSLQLYPKVYINSVFDNYYENVNIRDQFHFWRFMKGPCKPQN